MNIYDTLGVCMLCDQKFESIPKLLFIERLDGSGLLDRLNIHETCYDLIPVFMAAKYKTEFKKFLKKKRVEMRTVG
jgi:hypothetical protein